MVKPREVVLAACEKALAEDRLAARLTIIGGESAGASMVVDHELGVVAGALPNITDAVISDARAVMERERNVTLTYGDVDVFFETLAARPQLLIFGAVHIAQELSAIARRLGYEVTISDARPAFTTRDRFPHAERLLVGWPDQVADQLSFDLRTFVVVLSHDARFEDPLWPLIQGRSVRYIGAMGSARTAAARRERLAQAGWSDDEIGRIHGPIGIDIGAVTPGEVAIAIIAEMTRDRYRHDRPLETVGTEERITKGRS
jgi:xanthine dehydrogenase accessory factor